MVDVVPLKADKPHVGGEVRPSGFHPAVYQTGAEINALRSSNVATVPVSWVEDWEASGNTPHKAPYKPNPARESGGSQGIEGQPSPKVEDTPEVKAAVERNSKRVDQLFPDTKDEDPSSVKNAAYRYLMHRECYEGYPKMDESDMELLRKSGKLAELDKFVDDDFKKGLSGNSCPATS
jgi:hypothetical protein